MRRVLAVTRADASARLLVFSQWADVLELLAHGWRHGGQVVEAIGERLQV